MRSELLRLDVVWSTPAGLETHLRSKSARVNVGQGVGINVAFGTQSLTRVVSDLALSGRRPVKSGVGEASARFVIIPLDNSSILLAVAEPSAAAEALMPVPSTPSWLQTDGQPMPSQDGFLAVRRPHGVGLSIQLAAGSGEIGNACILKIACSLADGDTGEPGREPAALSIRRLGQDIVRIAADFRVGDDSAI